MKAYNKKTKDWLDTNMHVIPEYNTENIYLSLRITYLEAIVEGLVKEVKKLRKNPPKA